MTKMNNTVTGGGAAPRKLETKTCTRCGGSGRMPFAVYGGICFKCHGPGHLYTKRGRLARAFLDRIRSRTLADIRPGMLVWQEGFSCGSISVKSKFEKVTGIVGPKHCGRSKIGNADWVDNFGYDILSDGHSHGGVQLDSLHRLGHTAVGKAATLKAALDYQDALTKTGTVRKGAPVQTPEEFLANTDTTGWLVGADGCWALALRPAA